MAASDSLFTNAALGPIVEDWAEKYEDEEDEALWELVVFFIRVSVGGLKLL